MNRLSPQEPIKLTQTALESLFTPPTLMRARDYVMKGRVLSVKANADFRHIEGEVSGTERTPYRQDIRLVSMHHRLLMTGFCSCPATGHCKHIAAVLYSLLSDKTVEDQRITQWLHLLDEADNPKLHDVDTLYEDKVLYVLSKDDHGIFIELRRGKLAKKGGFNKGSKIALSDVQYYMPAWIGSEDVLILNLLLSARRHGVSRLYLKGTSGGQALNNMLATGRCFWEESRIPFSQGDAISPRFVWQDIDEDHKQLRLELSECDNWELIPTVPPAYIALDYFKIGPLDTEMSIDKLVLLTQMPPVPCSQLEAVSLQLTKHFPANIVPMPLNLDVIECHGPLTVRLTLGSYPLAQFAAPQPLVLLEFVYQEVVLSGRHVPQAISLVTQGEIHYQVTRQLVLENEATNRLMALGFIALEPSQLRNGDPSTSLWTLGPLPECIEPWFAFIERGVPALAALGYQVDYRDDFSLNVKDTPLAIELDDSQDGWFSLSLNADIEGQSIPMLPLIAAWLRQHGEPNDDAQLLLPSPNGDWLKVKAKTIKPLFNIILELFDGHKGNSVSLPKYRAHLLNEFTQSEISLLQGERVRNLAQKLAQFKGVDEVSPSSQLKAVLRHYQQQGLNWLCFLKEYQLGGILADDMGLGKTVQTLAFLQKQHELTPKGVRSPSLIICPTSLVGNWAKEAAKFTPNLKVVVIHGAQRQSLLGSLSQYDIVVTTYPLMVRDQEYYQAAHFAHIILDEAQQIKNAQAKVTQIIKGLPAAFRLCLTGTPLENHLGELKSLMDFCLPGLLGTQSYFNKTFKNSIERYGDGEKAALLRERIAPFVLRRTKEQVVTELPAKTEILQSLELEKDQRNLYESIRLSMEKKLKELFARQGVGSSHIEFLDALLKLRQACCDPRLVKLTQAQKVKNNAKLNWLTQNLPEMVQEGRKILIFSQFTSMLSLIEAELQALDIDYSKLTGQTRLRQAQIDKFQEGDTPVFLISLKAGGTGLNLTAADTVIHYDPWWNPAAEKQATDRAHRIGQTNPVFVYKLIAEGTVEEKIQEMQQHKQSLADSIFEGKGKGVWQGSADELLSLFSGA